MKITKIMAVAMAAVVGLTSCSKEDGVSSNDETQNLTIQIGQPEMTRSIDTPEANQTSPVTFSNGELFLCNAAGMIEYVYTFTSTGSTNLASKIIAISDVTSTNGVTIPSIKGSVVTAYVVGNSSAITGTAYSTAAQEGQYISAVKAVSLTTAMQYSSTNKDLSGVTLYGDGTLITDTTPETGVGTPTNAKKFVEVILRPHVARLEISDIKAVATTSPVVNITEFNVEGIYVNNYYSSISMDWTTPGTFVNPGQADATIYAQGTSYYPAANAGILHDYSATYFGNTLTALTKYPNGSNNTSVWAYNLIAAPKFGTGAFANATTIAPHIIVAINGVKADNSEDYSGMRFLTVNKLYNQSNVEITHFEAGKIYTIEPGDFEFTVNNTHTEAEIGEIDLRVKVSLITWTTESMTPGLQ